MRRTSLLVSSVALCVFCSGAGTLVLEVVWSRLLKLVFGSTTLAITTILVAYMFGLGLGGLLGGRLATRVRNGVRVYGLMEIAIGAYALFVPWLLGFYPWLNKEVLAQLSFWPAAFVRFGLVLVLLLLPTLMMGATLPVLVAALVRGTDGLAKRVGLLYGLNTLGAVAGVLVSTFVLFRLVGVRWTNAVGASLDLLAGAVAAFVIAPMLDAGERAPEKEVSAPASSAGWSLPLVVYGLVGFTALVYEVAWVRILTLVLGSSVYAFATMLAGFLAGIALGSLLARPWLDRLERPLRAFSFGIALLGLMAIATLLGMRELPDLFLFFVERYGISGPKLVWIGLAFSFCVMLPPTLVLGGLFPLAVRAVTRGDGSPGVAVGRVYFVNTLGSAMGAFLAGFVLIPTIGTLRTTTSAIALDFALAALLFLFLARTGPARVPLGLLGLAGAAWIALVPPSWSEEDLARGVYNRPEGHLDFGLVDEPLVGMPESGLLFYEEGINATVSVHLAEGGLDRGGLNMRLNGKPDASMLDMSTQILSGHIPFLFGPPAETALVIGFASGVTTGSATRYDLERIDVAEIESAVIEASRFFDEVNHRPLEQENVRLILDDGRTWLTVTDDVYDVIVSEPSNPWITGCSNLFTTEFFELVRERLAPRGRLLQWIQLYNMNPEGLGSILAALTGTFENVYGFLSDAGSGDLLLLATLEPLSFEDLPRWEDLPEEVRDDLNRRSIYSTADAWSLLALTPEELHGIAREAPELNTDDSMYVELEAPWNLYEDTRETSELIRSVARGVLPLTEGRELDGAFLSELAISYQNHRLFEGVAEAVANEAEARGDRATLYVYRAGMLNNANPAAGEEALGLLHLAVQTDPNAWAPRYWRANWLRQTEQYETALEDLDVAVRLRPDHLETRRKRVITLGSMERYEEALQEMERLLTTPLLEAHPRILADAAYLAAQTGDCERAVRYVDRFLEMFPYSPREWDLRAFCSTELGDQPGFVRARDNSALASTNLVIGLHRRARLQEQIGEIEAAIESLEEIRQMDSSYLPALEDLERLRGSGEAR